VNIKQIGILHLVSMGIQGIIVKFYGGGKNYENIGELGLELYSTQNQVLNYQF
jgi:hypothetical protein